MALGAWVVLAAVMGAATAQKDDCTCVPRHQCDEKDVVVQDSAGTIDLMIKGGECEHYLDVCCKEPLDAPRQPTVPTRQPGVCGHRNEDGVNLHLTGNRDNEAQFGEFPWMAAVLREEPSPGPGAEEGEAVSTSYVCGGSLVHPSVVLTAAHCITRVRSDRLWVRLGEWDSQTTKEPLPQQDRRVVKVALHPDFRDDALYNDVALLTLEKPVDITDHVDVVCLPPQDDVAWGASCFASGWGKDNFGKQGKYQVILKRVRLPIVERKECIDRLRETRLGKYFMLHESFICAGGAGHDTCKGDSGGPLVCPMLYDSTRFVLRGIVAWNIGCGGEFPAVYANVAKFRNWIDQQFLYANLNTTYAI